jgi:hypothetical protein
MKKVGLASLFALVLVAGAAPAQVNLHLDLSRVRTGQTFEASKLQGKVVKILDASNMAVLVDNCGAVIDGDNLVMVKAPTAPFSDGSYLQTLEDLTGKSGKVRVSGTTEVQRGLRNVTVFVFEPVARDAKQRSDDAEKDAEREAKQRLDIAKAEAKQRLDIAKAAVKEAERQVDDLKDALRRTISLEARAARQRRLHDAERRLADALDTLMKVRSEDPGK